MTRQNRLHLHFSGIKKVPKTSRHKKAISYLVSIIESACGWWWSLEEEASYLLPIGSKAEWNSFSSFIRFLSPVWEFDDISLQLVRSKVSKNVRSTWLLGRLLNNDCFWTRAKTSKNIRSSHMSTELRVEQKTRITNEGRFKTPR